MNHSGDKFLTGPSSGSSIAIGLLTKSKSLLDNTEKAMLLNTGYTSALHSSIKKLNTNKRKKYS